jgi:VCBS repeat-containing protein
MWFESPFRSDEWRTVRLTAGLVVAGILASGMFAAHPAAQQAQQNVNVLPIVLPSDPTSQSSIDIAAWTGDLYLQRQVEPTVAVSTRNPEHVLAFFNDYRAVDINNDIGVGEQSPLNFVQAAWRRVKGLFARLAGKHDRPRAQREDGDGDLPETAAASEAWVGGARSYDGAHSFTGMFVPGAPFDTSPAGMASPLKGFEASTDPVLVAAPCGRFYVALLGFTRNGASRMVVAEYEDFNDVEGGDTIKYLGMKVLEDANNSQFGYFLDKPAITVDVKRTANAGCGHNVYVSYTTFNGLTKDGKTQSKLTVARSTDSGETFSTTKINQPYQQGQGTSLAVDPQNGTLYVAWRHFNSPDTILVHKSTNFGQTWSGQPVDLLAGNTASPQLQKFDQPTVSTSAGDSTALAFRSLSFPSIAVGNGAIFVAFTERVDTDPLSPTFRKPLAGGSPRIVMMRSTNGGSSWGSVPDGVVNARLAIDMGDRDVPCADASCTPTPAGFGYLPQYRASGPQVMPQLTFAGGRLMLVYYESRGWAYQSPDSIDTSVGILPQSGGFITGLPRIMDVRASLLNISTGAVQGSSQVSRYPLKPWLKKQNGQLVPETLADVIPVNWPCAPDVQGATAPCVRAVNRVNSPTSATGTSPFIGDYIGIAGIQFVPKSDKTGWTWALTPSALPSRLFHGIFTDNRNLIPPPNPDDLASWQNYSPPWKSGACVNPGSRNTDVLTSRIDADLVISAPTSYKQLTGIQRAFPLVVTNGTTTNRYFRLSFASGGTIASFAQQAYDYSTDPPTLVDVNVDHLDVLIFPFSSVTRVAYVKPGTQTVQVAVNEIQGPLDPDTGSGGNIIPGGLSGTITLNPDASNPTLSLTTTETHAPSIGAPSIGAPSIGAPSIGAPSIGAPSIGAPSIGAPSIGAPSIGATTLGDDTVYGYVDTIWSVENSGNTSSGYLGYAHIDNPEQYEGYYKFQLMVLKSSTNGSVAGCQSANVSQDEILANVPLSTTDLKNPSIGAPSIGAPSIGAPSIGAVSFASTPPAEGTGSDGTLKAPKPKEILTIVLRAYRIVPWGTPSGDVVFDPSADTPSVAVQAQSKDVVNGVLQDTVAVAVKGADLIASAPSPQASPSSVQAGGTLTFPTGGWTLSNIGNLTATSVDGAIDNSVYLSAPGGQTPVTRIATPAAWTVSSSIGAGQSVTLGSASITIPANTAPGTYRLFVLADDGSQSVTGEVSEIDESNNASEGAAIVVTNPFVAPVGVNDTYSTDEDTPLTVAAPGVLGNDTDANGDTLTAVLVSNPANGTLAFNANGSFTYSPASNFNGSDSFTYKANDGALDSNIATVTITVNAVNDPPSAAAQSVSTLEDTPLAIVLGGSDPDNATLAFTIVTPPSHGVLTGVPPAVTYAPALNYFGPDAFTFRVSDGTLTSDAQVSISVIAVNDPPVANAQSVSTPENTPIAIVLTGTDAEGAPLTYAIVTPPAHGQLTGTAPNVTYTPAVNYVGSDSFTFKVGDGNTPPSGYTLDTAAVTLTIGGGLADYGFNGLLAPWTENPIYTANKGNSVPLSWQYLNPTNGKPADTSTLSPEMRFTKTANADCTGAESAPVINRDNPGNTYFMYINTKQSPQTWQFNWKTDDPIFTTGCWLVRIYLSATLQIDRPAGFKIILK